jgi:hypothetical protein
MKSPKNLNLPYPLAGSSMSSQESSTIKLSELEYGVYNAHSSFGEYTIRHPLVQLPNFLYEGEWDMVTKTPHGSGTSYSASQQEKYCGQSKHGKRDGAGRLILNNGDIDEGEFKNGHMSGSGTLIDSN